MPQTRGTVGRRRQLMLAVVGASSLAMSGRFARATDYAWNLPGDGLWTVNANWSPAGQPNAATDNVTIAHPVVATTPVTVTLPAGTVRAVGTLAISSSTGNANTLVLGNASQLTLNTGLSNNGVIRFDNTTSNALALIVNSSMTFGGTGSILMNGPTGTARITGAAALPQLTNGSAHTISGAGFLGLNLLTLNNMGTINANLSGRTLDVDVSQASIDSINRGTMAASNGGILAIDEGIYDNGTAPGTGGVFLADGAGSAVEFRDGVTINNGTIRSTNGGVVRLASSTNVFFNNVRFEGAISTGNNTDFGVSGSIVNAGTISVDPPTSSATDIEVQSAGVTFSGGGKIALGTGAGPNPGINGVAGTPTLVNAADHTIEGRGRFGQDTIGIDNRGLIRANNTTQSLVVDPAGAANLTGGVQMLNTGTLRAVTGSNLELNAGIYGNAGGVIEADGSAANVVLNTGVTIRNGTLRGINGGAIQVAASSNVFLENLTVEGSVIQLTNSDLGLSGTILNNGQIAVSPTTSNATDVEVQSGGATLSGTGTLTLGGPNVNPGINGVGAVPPNLVNGPSHTINGKGRFGQDTIGIINNGLIVADNAAQSLEIDPANGADTDGTGNDLDNIGILRAQGGATLGLGNGTYRNRDKIVADGAGSTVAMRNGAIVRGGTLSSLNGGTFSVDASATVQWENVTLEGDASELANADLVLNGSFTNNGTLTVAPTTSAATDIALMDNITIAGTGSLVLGGPNVNPGINSNTPGLYTLTNGLTHTISGKGRLGQDTIGIVNNGVIVATDTTTALVIDPSAAGFVNNSILRAQGGAGLALSAGSHRMTSGSSLLINAGSGLSINNGATLTLESGSTLTQNGAITIAGGGTLANQANVSPGTLGAFGTITMTGTFSNAAGATLALDVGGATPGTQFDQIAGTGSAALSGTLDLRIRNGYDPALYATPLNLIDDTSGNGISGYFTKVLNVGTSATKRWAVVYTPVTGATASEVVLVAAVPGDTDVNGKIEFADLLALAKSYNAANPTRWQQGDFDGNGLTNFDDLLALAKNYGYTAPPAADLSSLDPAFAADWALAQSMVPEPGVALIGLAAGATMLRRARRK